MKPPGDMCGIWLCWGKMPVYLDAASYVRALKARGPEGTRILDLSAANLTMGFTRLAINGLNPMGMQPFQSDGLTWMCNGEIYNWRSLMSEHLVLENRSGSDCEILGPLYNRFRDNLTSFFRSLDGVFALVIYDAERHRLIMGRDPYGVRPLFLGSKHLVKHEVGQTYTIGLSHLLAASEIKAMIPFCETVTPFPPGTYQVWDIQTQRCLHQERYHNVPWMTNPLYSPVHVNGLEMATLSLRWALEEAVRKRFMTERPMAALLSGGVDSSLIASLVQRHLRILGKPPLKTFSIGMPGSTDLAYAKKVADWIGSDHHEIVLTADTFFNAIGPVIRAIETYDTTTVRASVGNWLVSQAIRQKTDCKVVFNGDGSDEVFGSYLYFYNAPNDRAYEEEVERLLNDIHLFDVLRSDRSISSHGLEPRTPFLDKQFVATARSIATCWRRPHKGRQVEKWLLRRAFDDGQTLPHDVLWRRKEAFSDGVSSQDKSWYQIIQERVSQYVPEDWQQKAALKYPHLTPTTPEQYYYRYTYESEFGKVGSQTCTPYFWMPKWCPTATDPSARTWASL